MIMSNGDTIRVSIRGTDEDLYYRAKDHEKYCRVIADGIIDGKDGRLFSIVSNGTGFPTAYISTFKDDYIRTYTPNDDYARYEMLSCVHGWGTYIGKAYWDTEDQATYVGWDYAHAGDYCNFPGLNPLYSGTDHKWTIFEILDDCLNAAKQLRHINEHPEEYQIYVEHEEEKSMNKEHWAIFHGYTVDGGYGDAIWEEDMVGTVEATEDEINAFIEKYNVPIVYDHPYDDLTAHHIRAEKFEIKDISEIKPYGRVDYYGQQAREYQLRKKYEEEYGHNWMWSNDREKIFEKYNNELNEIRNEAIEEEKEQ